MTMEFADLEIIGRIWHADTVIHSWMGVVEPIAYCPHMNAGDVCSCHHRFLGIVA